MADTWRPAADDLVALTDDARLRAAVEERSHTRLLRQQAAEDATLAGTLRDLAERRAGVTVTTIGGRTYHGTLLGLGADHLVLATPARARVLVRTDLLATVRPDPTVRAHEAQGQRPVAQDVRLVEHCAGWLDDRPEVAVAVHGVDEPVRGVLAAVGRDVLSVVRDHGGHPIYLPDRAVEAVTRPSVDR